MHHEKVGNEAPIPCGSMEFQHDMTTDNLSEDGGIIRQSLDKGKRGLCIVQNSSNGPCPSTP